MKLARSPLLQIVLSWIVRYADSRYSQKIWFLNKDLKTRHAKKKCIRDRGGRYIDKKLSKADKSAFLKLSATYRYRKMEILKLSKNDRYRKMHQIWFNKYMKSQSIRNLISAKLYQKNARKITPSCLVTMKSSTD